MAYIQKPHSFMIPVSILSQFPPTSQKHTSRWICYTILILRVHEANWLLYSKWTNVCVFVVVCSLVLNLDLMSEGLENIRDSVFFDCYTSLLAVIEQLKYSSTINSTLNYKVQNKKRIPQIKKWILKLINESENANLGMYKRWRWTEMSISNSK